MTTATTLPQAAGLTFDNLSVWWQIPSQLKVRLGLFWGNVIVQFPDNLEKGRPVANWVTLLANLADQMGALATIDQLGLASEYVYRICWMTEQLRVQGLITTGQATSVLGSYNGAFG